MEIVYVLGASLLVGVIARIATHKRAEAPAQPKPTFPNMKDPHYANSDSSAQRVMLVFNEHMSIIDKKDFKQPDDTAEVRKTIGKKCRKVLNKLRDLFYRGMCARAGIEPYKDYTVTKKMFVVKDRADSLVLSPLAIKVTAAATYPAINDESPNSPSSVHEWSRLLEELIAKGVTTVEDLVTVLNTTRTYAQHQERTNLAVYNKANNKPKAVYFSHVGLVRISMNAFFTFESFRREREELLRKNRNLVKPVVEWVEVSKPEVMNSRPNKT